MATLFVRHRVKDFTTWKVAYDEFDTERKSMGVTGDGVYQTDGDPNEVTVYHHFADMESARAFMSSPRLKEIMEAAGIDGAPDVWFVNKA